MDRVTQQIAANAEESASSAEEMNAQAKQTRSYAEELAGVIGGVADEAVAYDASPAVELPVGMIERGKSLLHEAPMIDDSKGKASGKKAGIGSEALIPFGDDEKGAFKDS